MQQETITNYLPPFMASRTECDKSAVIPVEGVDYRYDSDGQTAVPINCMSRPTGYHTNQGQDWVTTDQTYIDPTPNGPN